MTETEATTKTIQGLQVEDAEGSYYFLLAKVILSQEFRKTKRGHVSDEK